MKRSLSFGDGRQRGLVLAGIGLIAGTYGLVRLAYGLFLPDIRASLTLGSAAAGYVSTGASVAYGAGALAGLAVPHRPRLLVAGALATAAAGSLGMALAPGPALFAPAAVVASVSAGLASPGLVAIVARNLAARDVDRAQAVVNSGTGPGLVAAGLLALLLVPWRVGFLVGAALTVAAGVAVLLLDRRLGSPARAGRIPAPARLQAPAVAAALLGAASAVVWTYGRSHLVSAGAGTTGSIVAWTTLGLGGTATALTARRLSDRSPRAAWLLTTSIVAGAVAVLGLAPERLAAAVAACGVFGWGFVAATSALIAWVEEAVPGHAAPGTSILFVTLVLGQAAGSAAAGALAGPAGLRVAFLLAAVVAVLAGACALAPPVVSAAAPGSARRPRCGGSASYLRRSRGSGC